MLYPMVNFLYRALEHGLSTLKKREYRLDRSIPLSLLVGTVLRRFGWLVRGAVKCLVLQRRVGFVFMAPKVNLRNAALIRFGKGVTLERGVIVDGLSRDGIEFGDNVMIGPYSVIRAGMLSNLGVGVRMGGNCSMDAYSYIGAGGPVTIGDNVIMGQHIAFHSENHEYDRVDIPIKHQGTRRKGIVIEDDCWVGSNTTFLDGAHVGCGCVIAAGSLVRGEIPPYSIVVGAPARVLRSRVTKEAPNSQTVGTGGST
jgi:acetyltransferase-like isoleucine patch superfamily enzyme